MTDLARIEIIADSSQIRTASGDLDQLTRQSNTTESSLLRLSGGIGSVNRDLLSMSNIAGLAARAFASFGLASFLEDVLRINREMQVLRTSLETVTGSATLAGAAFSMIKQFAATTPFSIQQVTEAFIKLKSLGLDPSEKALQSYGNTASAMGKSLTQMIEAVADASTGEFERLKEFGITASKSGNQVALTFQGVTKTIGSSAAEITQYLQDIGNINFAGGMDRMAKTIEGSISNLQDAWNNFKDDLINAEGETAIANFIAALAANIPAIGNAFVMASAGALSFAAAEGLVVLGSIGITEAFAGMVGILTTVGALNPFVALITTIGVATAATYLYRDSLTEVEGIQATVGTVAQATWQTVQDYALSAIAGIVNTLPNISIQAAQVSSFLATVFGSAWTYIKSATANAINVVIGYIVAIGTAAGQTAAALVQYFSSAFSKVQAMARAIQADVKAAMSLDFSFSNVGKALDAPRLSISQAASGIGTSIKQAFSKDYVGEFGAKLKGHILEIQKASVAHANLGGAVAASIPHLNNAAGGAGRLGGAHHGAAGGAGRHAAATKQLTDAQKEQNKLIEDGKRLTESFLTPQEKAAETLATASKLYSAGAINLDTLDKALIKYNEDMQTARNGQTDFNRLLKESKDFNSLKSSTADAESLVHYAQMLQMQGLSTTEIKTQIEYQKGLNAEVAKYPDLNYEDVTAQYARKMAAEKQLQELTAKGVNESSKAWEQAIRNMQDTFGGALKDAMNGDFDFSKLKNSLYTALSQAISSSIIDSFNNKDWGGFFSGLFAAGVTIAAGWLSRETPALTQSQNQKNRNSTQVGSGAEAIGDSVGRGQAFLINSATNAQFNNAVASVKNTVLLAKGTILDSIVDFGKSLLQSPVLASVKNFFAPFTEAVSGAWTSASNYISSIVQKITTWVGATFNIAGQSASAVAGTGSATLGSNLASTVSSYLGVITAIYSVYTYFTDLGQTLETGNAVYIIGATLVMIGAVVAGVAAAAVLMAAAGIAISTGWTGVGLVVAAVVAIVGALMMAFSKIREPNFWLNTMPNPDEYQKNPNFDHTATGLFTKTQGKSSYVGTETAFGEFVISAHEMNLTAKEMVDTFSPLIFTVKNTDQAFANTIEHLDMVYGQTGQTMSRYAEQLRLAGGIQINQNANDLNTGGALDQRYASIVDLLGATGTKAGEGIKTWFEMFASKFSAEQKANNPGYAMSLVQAMSSIPKDGGMGFAEMLLTLPEKFVGVINDSIKTLKNDNPFGDLIKQAGDIITKYMQTKLAFSAMGDKNVNEDRIIKFLGDMNSIGIAASDASDYLMGYARAISVASKDVADHLSNAVFDSLDKLIADLNTKGLDKEHFQGYLSTFILMAGQANDLGIAVSKTQLDDLAIKMNATADASSQASNEFINHAIATENLGSMSREAAIQILLMEGTIKDTDVAAANFGISLTKAQQAMNDGIGFAAQAAAMAGMKISDMGITFETLTNVGTGLTSTFGDLSKAMSFLDTVLKAALTPTAYASAKQNAAQYSFDAASKAMGNKPGYSASDFQQYVESGKFIQETINLGGSTNQADKDKLALLKQQGEAYAVLTETHTNYVEAVKTETKVVDDSASKVKALADAQKGVYDRIAELAGSDLSNGIAQINQKIRDLIETASSNGGSLNGLDVLKTAELKDLFSPIKKEFDDLSQSDYSLKLQDLNNLTKSWIEQAPVMAETWGVSTNVVIEGIDAIYKKRKEALDEEGNAIIRNQNKVASRLNNSDFENSLWQVRDKVIDVIVSAAKAGKSYDELLTIASQGAAEAGKVYKDAQAALNSAFKDKNDSLADKIYVANGGKDLNGMQKQRALIDLQNEDLKIQQSAVEKLISLNDERYQQELANVTKFSDLLHDLLTSSTLSILTPAQKLTSLQQDYDKYLAGANNKDQKSIDKFPGAATALLEQKLAMTANKEDYARIYSRIRGDVEKLAGVGTTDEMVKTAQIEQVKELQSLQQKFQSVTQAQTAALISAFDKVGADFVNTLQAMAGPTKDVKNDLNMKVVSDAAPDSFANFKKTILDVLGSGVLTPADGELLKNSSLHLIANLSGLILTQQIKGTDAAAIMDASIGVVGNLGKLVNAQMITPADAVGVYNAQLGIFEGLTGLIKKQLISPDSARFVYDAQASLIGSLSNMILNSKITTQQAGGLLVGQNDFVNNLIAIVAGGQVSQESGGKIYIAQFYLIGALINAIDTGRIAGKDVSMITNAVTQFSSTVSGQLKMIKLSAADNSLYSNAVTEMSNVISSAISSQKFSAEQIGILTTGLSGYASNPAQVLEALHFSQKDLDTLVGSLSKAAGNPAKVFELLGFSPADQTRLAAGLGTLSDNTGGALAGISPGVNEIKTINQGVTALAVNMHSGLSDVQFLAEPGNIVRAGVNSLAYNIGGGLGSVSIDNSPVNSAINTLMSSLAVQVYDARTTASSIIADASAQARAAEASRQLQATVAPVVASVDPVAAFNAAYKSGNYSDAARIGINAGYSKPQIAQYVEGNYGVKKEDVLSYLNLQGYANGGITNTPAIFGEAGWEAAVPLDGNRSIPVTISSKGENSDEDVKLELEKLRLQMAEYDAKNTNIQKQQRDHLELMRVLMLKQAKVKHDCRYSKTYN